MKHKKTNKLKKITQSNLPVATSPVKRKRRKMRDDERPYSRNARGGKGKPNGHSLDFRFNTQDTVINKSVIVNKKTAALFHFSPLKGLTEDTVNEVKNGMSETKSNTPIKKILRFSKDAKKFPEKVQSSSSELYCYADHGFVALYSNDPCFDKPENQSDEEFVIRTPFFESEAVKETVTAVQTQKKVIATINLESLKEVAKEIKKNEGKRSISQNTVMGYSATKYLHAAEVSLSEKGEWAHLVAHRFLSDLSQCPENLVATTNHTNTAMIPLEDAITLLATFGEVKIEVTAHLAPNTHIATKIEYDVNFGEHTFKFSFMGQQLAQPDIAHKDVLKTFFSVLCSKKMLTENDEKTPPMPFSPELISSGFFSKSADKSCFKAESDSKITKKLKKIK